MKREQVHGRLSIRSEVLARIFLKPQAGRYIGSLRLIDALLGPVAKLFSPRRRHETRPVESILVFDPGALGDMMMLLPFLGNLRAAFPISWIVLVGRPGAGDLLLERSLVDECISVEIPWAKRETSRWQRHQPFSPLWWRLIRGLLQLRNRQFDLGFAAGWGGDIRGNLAIWLAGASRRVGYGYGGGGFLLTDVVEPDLRHPHVADRNLRLLEPFWVQARPQHPAALQIPVEDTRSAEAFLERQGVCNGDLLIGIHPGAGSPLREWGDERFAEVAKWATDRFGAKILWFTDPNKPRGVPAGLNAVEVVVSFRQLLAVLSHCHLFLCNDSGPMHVAAALKVPVVTMFGPTQAEWFRPYGEGHRVVIRNDMWCRPCADRCRWKEPYCLRLITVEQAMEAVSEAVRNIAPCRTGMQIKSLAPEGRSVEAYK